MKIILADDHALIRSGVASVLSVNGYPLAASVADGEAALEAISTLSPDIAILDVRMPKMDGVEVLRHIFLSKSTTSVILLTADLLDEHLIDALRYDVKGIVLKDGAEDRLVECIRTVAAGRKYIDQELMQRAIEITISPTRDPLADLSNRERELATFVGQGFRNRQIAEQMGLTEGTVKVYLNAIYTKLSISNRTALALVVASRADPGKPS